MSEIAYLANPIALPSLIFKFIFRPYFGLYSQAETTSVTTKTRTKILRGVLFEKILIKNLHDALTESIIEITRRLI